MATRIQTERKTEGPGGSSTTVKTTTYETSRSYETDGSTYRPGIQGRNLIIQRSSYGGPATTKMTVDRSMNYSMAAAPGAYANISAVGSNAIKSGREKEKKDMQDLNERFASYIERVRFLEAQNRKLADELDRLKSKWGKETTAIKAMYQAELDEARRLLDDAEKEKARLQIRVSTLEEMLEEMRVQLNQAKADIVDKDEKISKQNETLSSYESEINLLQRRVESLENDREKDKKEIARLQECLNKARIDLDNETLAHIDAENRRQTLEEELEFLKQVHDQEMKELAALAYRDTTNENREFWKSELANAIREIQSTYDEKLDSMRGELETYYNMKVQEFRTGAAKNNMESVHAKEETKRLRGQLTDLRAKLAELESRNHCLERELNDLKRDYEEKIRELEIERNEFQDQAAKRTAELEAVLKELQDLMDSKLGLELEIAAYRKLLEGEENNLGLRQVVESIIEQQGVRSQRADEAMAMYSVRQTEQISGGSGHSRHENSVHIVKEGGGLSAGAAAVTVGGGSRMGGGGTVVMEGGSRMGGGTVVMESGSRMGGGGTVVMEGGSRMGSGGGSAVTIEGGSRMESGTVAMEGGSRMGGGSMMEGGSSSSSSTVYRTSSQSQQQSEPTVSETFYYTQRN